jgi:hypothetical protein
MQGVDNPVARVLPILERKRASTRLCTYLHPYTVGCYTEHRLLMRKVILKTYPPTGVTSDSSGPLKRGSPNSVQSSETPSYVPSFIHLGYQGVVL